MNPNRCARKGPFSGGQCSKPSHYDHQLHHSLDTGEKWAGNWERAALAEVGRALVELYPAREGYTVEENMKLAVEEIRAARAAKGTT